MKIKVDRALLIKAGFILVILVAIPFLPELLVFIDVAGIDLAIAFFTLYFATGYESFKRRLLSIKVEIAESYKIITQLYMFKPKVYCVHAVASSAFLVITGSIIFSTLLWFPVVLLSSGAFGGYV